MAWRHQLTLHLLVSIVGVAGFFFFSTKSAFADEVIEIPIQTTDPYQAFFLIAIGELQKQNFTSAIKILSALNEEVSSQRIQLELARAYYLDRQFENSRRLFESVLNDETLPWGVRENVERYLDLIDQALGSIKFALSLVKDSNPLNYTKHRQIKIAGQTLYLTPPKESKESNGIQYSLYATKALTDDATFVGYLNTTYDDFKENTLDQWIIDLGLAYFTRHSRKYEGKIGLEESFYGGDHLYRQPYLSATYYPDPIDQFRFSSELQLAYLDVDNLDYLDAHKQTVFFRASRILNNGWQVLGNTYLENAATDEEPYSYRGAGLGITLSIPLINTWGVSINGSVSNRKYRDRDPFFLETRSDLTESIGLRIQNRGIRILGFFPELGVSYEQVDSNIDYFEYDKLMFIFRAAQ